MNKINRVSDLRWFDVSNYDCLLELTNSQLINELYIRSEAFKMPEEAEILLLCVEKGLPVQNKELPRQLPAEDQSGETKIVSQISKSRSVRPASLSRIREANQLLEKYDDNAESERHNFLTSFSAWTHKYKNNCDMADSFAASVILEVVLKDRTNAEVLAEVKSALMAHRRELGIPEPAIGTIDMGEKVLAKIMTHRTIPFLDLILWQELTGNKISNETLNRVLFKDDASIPPPETQLIQKTYIPAAMRTITEEYLTKAFALLNSDKELASRKVATHLEINGCQYP